MNDHGVWLSQVTHKPASPPSTLASHSSTAQRSAPLCACAWYSISSLIIIILTWSESQKNRQRVSNADQKVIANPESFCNKLIICWRISGYFGKCPDTIQNIQIICKVSGWTGKFPDDLKSVGMNWKVSIWCKKCPDNLKNVSGYSKKGLDDVEMYLENLEGFGWS